MPGLSKEDASVELKIDPSFTGILRGETDDLSEGCVLKGSCVLHVQRTLRVNKLTVVFEGQCKVGIKSTSSIGTPAAEGVECRTLIRRVTNMNLHNTSPVEFRPGDYTYPFRFELPSTLPASFRGKWGRIRYRLEAVVHRASSFMGVNKHIRNRMDICLRRCLLSDTILNTPLLDTIYGQDHTDMITYSASAPSIAYREGGLVQLNLTLQLTHPDTQLVRSVTCALRERIVYHTTGQQSLTCQVVSKTDDLFPLGWSTFDPSKSKGYNPHQKQDYNAEFRLCPRVNADSTTCLLDISHALVVNIIIKDITTPFTDHNQVSVDGDDAPLTPPTSPPTSHFHRTSSSSSLEDIVKEAANAISSTIKRKNSSNNQLLSPPLPPTIATTPTCRQQLQQRKMYVCSLECPIVVTSRERYWEGDHPNPPVYQATEEPPTYGQTLIQLPPAPDYD